jgi:hypothetical protein
MALGLLSTTTSIFAAAALTGVVTPESTPSHLSLVETSPSVHPETTTSPSSITIAGHRFIEIPESGTSPSYWITESRVTAAQYRAIVEGSGWWMTVELPNDDVDESDVDLSDDLRQAGWSDVQRYIAQYRAEVEGRHANYVAWSDWEDADRYSDWVANILNRRGRDPRIDRLAADRPVVHVSYDDAQDFTERLSQGAGVAIGLPTGEQWEHAVRLLGESLLGVNDRVGEWVAESPEVAEDVTDDDLLRCVRGGPCALLPELRNPKTRERSERLICPEERRERLFSHSEPKLRIAESPYIGFRLVIER